MHILSGFVSRTRNNRRILFKQTEYKGKILFYGVPPGDVDHNRIRCCFSILAEKGE